MITECLKPSADPKKIDHPVPNTYPTSTNPKKFILESMIENNIYLCMYTKMTRINY